MRARATTGFVILTALFVSLSLAGCAGRTSGVSGSTLVRAEYPRASVTGNPPLSLRGYARTWVSLPSDYLGVAPTGVMDYAVYGEGGEGPVTRHAHALFVRPTDDRAWRFKPESFKPLWGLAIGRKDINGYRWTVQVLRIDAEKDWFSAMWRESGREVPDLWLARRFSATPERSTRIVAEYREPWPECLDRGAKDLMFASKSCLEGFFERSDAAFSLDMHAPETMEEPAAPSSLPQPAVAPDMGRLAGELMEEDYTFRRWR